MENCWLFLAQDCYPLSRVQKRVSPSSDPDLTTLNLPHFVVDLAQILHFFYSGRTYQTFYMVKTSTSSSDHFLFASLHHVFPPQFLNKCQRERDLKFQNATFMHGISPKPSSRCQTFLGNFVLLMNIYICPKLGSFSLSFYWNLFFSEHFYFIL